MTKRAPKKPAPDANLREPSEMECASIVLGRQAMKARGQDRANAPLVNAKLEGGKLSLSNPHTDGDGWSLAILNVLGTNSDAFGDMMMAQLGNATGVVAEGHVQVLNQGLAFMAGVQPKDEVECAIGAQMFATHCATMELGRRMMKADLLPQMEAYGTLQTKLARTFTAQAEALAKLRSGGKQQVEVRYVYVDARGSQVAIGVPGGGGRPGETDAPCHAPAGLPGPAPADVVPLRSPDALRLAMSGAGGQGQEAMQDARRDQPRRRARQG